MIRFYRPEFLLLLLLIPVLYLLGRRITRFNWILLRRIILILLLVVVLAGLLVARHADRLCVIFAWDISQSMDGTRDQALAFLTRAVRNMKNQDLFGILIFGRESYLVKAPQVKAEVVLPTSFPDSTGTDLTKAISASLNIFPSGYARKIVLISDGNHNVGDLYPTISLARSQQVEISVVPLASSRTDVVRVEEVVTPGKVNLNQTFELKVMVNAFREGLARLLIFRNQQYVGEKTIPLTPGKSAFQLPQSLDKPGFYSYEVYLEWEEDPVKENNQGTGFVTVQGKPRVWYLEGDPLAGLPLRNALMAQGLDVEMEDPSNFLPRLNQLPTYDALILSEVSASTLTLRGMKIIQHYVQDMGGGLIMLGGSQSFAPGGYSGTPLEEVLPVYMDVAGKMQVPSLALMLVIDRSGSMGSLEQGIPKVELAKEAVQLVIDILSERNEIGVIAFDTSFNWVVPLQKVKDKEKITQAVATIQSGGGTDMYPAMQEGHQALKKSRAQIKHLILLTDGISEPHDFASLVREMVKDGITLSSVAVGKDADVRLLANLAEIGRGRYYYTDDAYSIPRIFVQETRIASRTDLVEEPFRVRLISFGELIRGIKWEEAPPLRGYVVTVPKNTAEVWLRSHREDPVLLSWRYGLGKAVAFTSDAKTRWANWWLAWPGYQQFWGQVVRWVLKERSPLLTAVSTHQEGNEVWLTSDVVDEEENFVNFLNTEMVVVAPSGERQVYPLEQVAPGRYDGKFLSREMGSYLLALVQKKGNQVVNTEITGFAFPYSPEYQKIGLNEEILENVVWMTGGEFIHRGEEVFSKRSRLGITPTEWQLPFLLTAIILFVLDVGFRHARLGEWLKTTATRIRKKEGPAPSEVISYPELVKKVKGEPPSYPQPSTETLRAQDQARYYAARIYLARKGKKR